MLSKNPFFEFFLFFHFFFLIFFFEKFYFSTFRKIVSGNFSPLSHIGKSQKLFSKNYFPGKFHEYLPMKKYFFPKTGHDSEAFPETFSNVWKKFPDILLCHYPNLRNFKFHLKSLILEKVSGKSSE